MNNESLKPANIDTKKLGLLAKAGMMIEKAELDITRYKSALAEGEETNRQLRDQVAGHMDKEQLLALSEDLVANLMNGLSALEGHLQEIKDHYKLLSEE